MTAGARRRSLFRDACSARGCGGTVDARLLKSQAPKACGFDSHHPHLPLLDHATYHLG